MKKLNNKGITLVELLISIGIFSVVMASLFGMLSIVTKNYSRNNAEVNVQNEAQTLMNHLDDVISPSLYGAERWQSAGGVNLGNETLVIYYEKSYACVWADLSEHEVYYFEGTFDDDTYTNWGKDLKNSKEIRDAKSLKVIMDFFDRKNAMKTAGTLRSTCLLAERVDEFQILETNNDYGYVGIRLAI